MDIAERRLPQDGRVSFEVQARTIDIRVASLPTDFGERIALRFFDTDQAARAFDDLGMPSHVRSAIEAILGQASGLFLTCGPTGSGKTTTMYAALERIDRVIRHICTVEDPVERRIAGLSQVSINQRSGLNFAVALRALLRQDPDVIMIGEIRDEETAQTAVNAALTGQLVLATVHGHDAYAAMERMQELGVRRPSLQAVLSGILAQRLVRRLCSACRIAEMGEFHAGACENCGFSGYRGRIALFDLMLATDAEKIRLSQMAAQADVLCAEGITTRAEIARVASGWKLPRGC
jgi:general secretion pathway protein E